MYESFACDARETGPDHRGLGFGTARSRVESATQVLLGFGARLLLLVLLPTWTLAANLTVTVKNRDGDAVGDAVVTAFTLHKTMDAASQRKTDSPLVMDQLGMRFVPEVLVVPVGGEVSFPNSDAVSHQVYSFSKAKRFQLALYKGVAHPPVRFDTPGLVVVGCNIHDQMAGYIYVTDARWYGKTAPDGNVVFDDIPTTDIEISVWSPRIADAADTLTRHIKVTDAPQAVEFRLNKKLRGTPEPRPRNANWDY